MNVPRVPQSEGLKHRKLEASILEHLGPSCAQDKGLGFSMDTAPP